MLENLKHQVYKASLKLVEQGLNLHLGKCKYHRPGEWPGGNKAIGGFVRRDDSCRYGGYGP